MIKIAAQKDDTPHPFFLHDLQCHIHFILILINMIQHHCIFFTFDLRFYHFDHTAENRIGHSLYKHRNALCIYSFQIPRTVIRNIAMFPYCIHDLLFCLRIDIRMVIDGAGDSADSHAAYSCHIFNGQFFHTILPDHASASPAYRSASLSGLSTSSYFPK